MRYLMAAALLSGLALAGCGDDSGKNHNDLSGNTDGPVNLDGGGDGGPGDQSFEAYVKDLIQNHTDDTGKPDDYTTKTFGADNTDPAFFPASFFQ